MELFVCSLLGGKYPYMRDGLILHKSKGDSMVYRHLVVWMQSRYWTTSTVSPITYQMINAEVFAFPVLC